MAHAPGPLLVSFESPTGVSSEEYARVLEEVEALRQPDFVTFGRLMEESHRSLREDYEASTPKLNTFVGLAARSGLWVRASRVQTSVVVLLR